MVAAGLARISVVIVTYESADCIARAVSSIRRLLPSAELVVVDNHSRDATVSIVRELAPDARVLVNSENLGFGRASNQGAEAARTSHVLFANPDTTFVCVDPEHLLRVLETRPFGLIAPAVEGEHERRRPERSWVRDYADHTLGMLWPRTWRRRSLPRLRAEVWVSGGMLLAERAEFLGLGGFDPRFFLYYEDRDLSRRYREAGLPISTTAAIRAGHVRGTSSASDDLRVVPLAWSLLGWIEYLHLHEREATARRAARLAMRTLRVMRVATGALAALPSGRLSRKARQVDALLSTLRRIAYGDDRRFCPDAIELVREIL